MKEHKIQCRLCEQYFSNSDMSEEHYPAHCTGNDDIVRINIQDLLDTLMGDNPEFNEGIKTSIRSAKDPIEFAERYFDNTLSKSLYPKGRTARTLCRECNTFLGKYDESYQKFFSVDGDPQKIKGFQTQTKINIIKAIYAKFLSLPEALDINFDFLDFIRDREISEYNGEWHLYFIRRDSSTDMIGLQDIQTGKMNWDNNKNKIVLEMPDDKFIYNLCNFEKPAEFEMNDIFDILKGNYRLIIGAHDNKGSFHQEFVMKRIFNSF